MNYDNVKQLPTTREEARARRLNNAAAQKVGQNSRSKTIEVYDERNANMSKEDKLAEIFDEYFPEGAVTSNDNRDDDKALLMTQVLKYRRNNFKESIEQLLHKSNLERQMAENQKYIDEYELDVKSKWFVNSSGGIDFCSMAECRIKELQKELEG